MQVAPDLEAGLVHVRNEDAHTYASMQRLALDNHDGETLWIDVAGAADTYAMTDLGASRRELHGIQVARAFQCFNHYELVRATVERASGRTNLAVCPTIAALYAHADEPQPEVFPLFRSSIAVLAELANALVIPVLVSTPHATEEYRAVVEEHADHAIDVEDTRFGVGYSTEDFQTQAYWSEHWWQTTVPYWVELLGSVDEWEHPAQRKAAQRIIEWAAEEVPASG